MATTVRTTISVPRELKDRMDAIGEPVNWSSVACRAFEQKLAEVISKRGTRDMKDVIQRLRASKAKSDNDRRQAGIEAGRQWAQEAAEAGELERLAKLDDPDLVFVEDDRAAYSPGEVFVGIIEPESEGDRQRAHAFWELQVGDDQCLDAMCSADYVQGFAEGALDLWYEVKDQL